VGWLHFPIPSRSKSAARIPGNKFIKGFQSPLPQKIRISVLAVTFLFKVELLRELNNY